MYNFRYHLVTIVSIFAALALGLLLGVAITGSDLVRDASSNLAESLTDQFDDLSKANDDLSDQLQTQQLFSQELLSGWQADRLVGRTIVILTRTPKAEDSLADGLSSLIAQCGGIPVIVRLDPSAGFALEDESSTSNLKEILPEVKGEAYDVTLARALTDEWSFAVEDGTSPSTGAFEENYPLTELLVKNKRIEVTTAYQSLIKAINTEGTWEAAALAQQRFAFELAERLRLPYGANGVIDTAVFSLAENEQQISADPVALQIALHFDQKGAAGELPYRKLSESETEDGSSAAEQDSPAVESSPSPGSRQSSGLTESSEANYYALLAQQAQAADVMLDFSQETGLSCELVPLEPIGHYGVIALLSGAKKGAYGLSRNGVTLLPPIPTDAQGNAPFLWRETLPGSLPSDALIDDA
jgi:hypothetical protein